MLLRGTCVVISPLIALMQDQVARLEKQGIPAVCLHSGLKYTEVKRLLGNAVNDEYKLLYLSPERLQSGSFREYFAEMDVSMLAVDEAHCISQWGHDFRPSYLKIADAREYFPKIPILALTASATPHVQADISKQLGLRAHAVFRQSFARENIFYDVRYSENKNGDTLRNIGQGSTIIYNRSRKQTEAIGKYLGQHGIPVSVYHAGLAREKREHAQEEWMTNATSVMSATTAFGMGIDKPDVRTVLHYDAPEHLEAYYQEAGRAGRDGNPSAAIAFYNTTDIKRLHDSTALHYPPEDFLRKVYQAVVEYLQIPISAQPDKYFPFDLADFCQKFDLKAVRAIHALKLLEQERLWTMTEAVYSPGTIMFTADRYTLDSLSHTHPALFYLANGLLRMYNTVFHFPTPVRESAIARQLRMKVDEVKQTLLALHRMEILEYNVAGDGPQLFFHHYRVDSSHLLIDSKRINTLRLLHQQRTAAMIAFLQNDGQCREQLLLTYFGEEVKHDCGHCDICRNKKLARPDEARLSEAIVKHITASPGGTVDDLLSNFPRQHADYVVKALRHMADNDIVDISRGGTLSML